MKYEKFTRQISSVAIVAVAIFSWTASSVSAGPGQAVGGISTAPAVCTQGFKAGPKDSKGNYKCTSKRIICSSNQSVFFPKYVASIYKFEYTCAYPVKSGVVPKAPGKIKN
ncbi:hypothetical protein MNBD_GAMMA21-2903 [hydrothermal vent metagenome]|uniref:Uncharacterized protein n=1 Tax=hydrothermal vent metagenome TaxID=652676 RepID=A0A3B0ZW60_9ZZZZ